MSTILGPSTVLSSVEAVCSTYRDGFDLIQRIRAKRKARKLLRKECPQKDESIDDLERSLGKGNSVIRGEFDHDLERIGDSFGSGDQIARDALKDINIHLQQQILSKLKLHWQRDAHIDIAALQHVSDSAQSRCIQVLMQLQQRIITTGPLEDVTPPPLNVLPSHSQRPLPVVPPPEPSPGQGDWGFEFTRPRPLTPPTSPPVLKNTENPMDIEWSAASTFAPPSTVQIKRPSPPNTASGPKSKPLISGASQQTLAQQFQPSHRYTQSQAAPSPPLSTSHHREGSKGSSDSGNRTDGKESQYKPLATTTEKVGFFGIRKKRVEMIPDMPENPLVDKYLNEAIEEETRSLRRGSIGTARSAFTVDPEESSIYPYNEADDDTTSILTATSNDYPKPMERVDSRPKPATHRSKNRVATLELLSSSRPLASIDPKDLLPNELNNYAGFCKGAWRQQIGDRKKAMEERVKPGSMYNSLKYWQCKSCKFEGRYVQPKSKKDSSYDLRIAKLVDGIQFRWEFLFKSHIASPSPVPDPREGVYGCIFCCAEGQGTPVFEGVIPFVKHLVEHRDRLPTGDVLYRMNCLVGRRASPEENFDVNIMSREGGLF